MTRLFGGFLCVCLAASTASAASVKGKVVADGSEVYLVSKGGSVLVSGDARAVDTTAGRLASFLNGEQVELEGRLLTTKLGSTILPSEIRSPRFARITGTVESRSTVRWRGLSYPATGFVRHTPKNTNFEAFLFGDPKKPSRIHLARAQVQYKNKTGYVRHVGFDSFSIALPLPPGDWTVLWHSEWYETDIENAAGKVIHTEVDLDDLAFVQGTPKPDGKKKKRRGAKSRVDGLLGTSESKS